MIAPGAEELVFLPLGGAGEIGMNLNLYGWGPPDDRRWLMIDCGLGFNGNVVPGVDIVLPDPAYIAGQRGRLVGLVLTHAHEDHLGALPYLWPQLRCPVYATRFTRAMMRHKLRDGGAMAELQPMAIPENGELQVGPFSLQLIGMTHSIPDAQAIVIRTPAATVLHTGDWKLDPEPVVGPTSDEVALGSLGDAGVDALVCDSTNVFVPGRTGSEASLQRDLHRLIVTCRRRVVVTCFASNIARIATIAAAAQAAGRVVLISGGSLRRTCAAAQECGYLSGLPPLLDDGLFRTLPAEKCLVVCTGGQGEPRAALSRIVQGEHPHIDLDAGDAVIFSSRVIPGNEIAIGRLYNALLRRNIAVLTHRDGDIHVSGHPARGDLERMYALVRPRVAVPVHGELRHMLEHAELAKSAGVPERIVAENGTVVRLTPRPACIVERVAVGRLAVEGNRAVAIDGELVRNRVKAIYNGAVTVTVVLQKSRPAVREVLQSFIGVVDQGEDNVVQTMREAVRQAVEALPDVRREDDAAVAEAARIAVRRAARQAIDKRPLAQVHVVRV